MAEQTPLRVVEFRQPDPNQEIVEMLEGLLKTAKSGGIKRIVCVAQEHGGAIYPIWRFGGSFQETVGLIEIARHDLLNDALMRELGFQETDGEAS